MLGALSQAGYKCFTNRSRSSPGPAKFSRTFSSSKPSASWKAIEPLLKGAVMKCTKVRPCSFAVAKKALVEAASDSLAPQRRRDPEHVHVGLAGIGLGEKAEQKSGQLARPGLGDEARALEVDEEDARHVLGHLAPAPPLVDERVDAPVVGGVRVPDLDLHRRERIGCGGPSQWMRSGLR